MSRIPREPLPLSFFDGSHPGLGDGEMSIRLGDIALDLEHLSPELALPLRSRYGPYAGDPSQAGGGLRIRVLADDREYFIAPPARPEFNPVLLALEGDRVRFLGYRAAGWFDVAREGRGELVISRGGYEPIQNAAENYIRAAVAWQAAIRGGALIHAASAVHRGRGYLFYGESGAGKSTLSACNRRARIVSDDLSLVLADGDGRLELVGSPFRGTYEGGDPVHGRFPLVAGFRIVQDTEASVRPVPRVRALSELVGNLPFVAEAFDRRPELFAGVERAFASIPLSHLHFTKDESYWDAIERAGL